MRNSSRASPVAVGIFRGYYAAASLKLNIPAVCWAHLHIFRGYYAAASLKRKGLEPQLVDLHIFRGYYAAASLKRHELGMAAPLEAESSAATTPRPH